MVYIKRAVMIMEPPSPASLERKDALERQKLGGVEGLGKRKRGNDDEDKIKKKKKGPKEPNPLSMKRKKKAEGTSTEEANEITTKETNKGADEELNVIGGITEETRRHKRRRKHHKKPISQENETITAETES
jgi:U3 small nucleolar RNA-associated protein 23